MKKTAYVLIGIAALILMFGIGMIKIDINITSSSTTQTETVTSRTVSARSRAAVVEAKGVADTTVGHEKISADGVDEKVKEFWNSYEAFADEYCEFAENYDPENLETAVKAMDYMSTALTYAADATEYDEAKMPEADAKYVAAVRERVDAKMAKINADIQ